MSKLVFFWVVAFIGATAAFASSKKARPYTISSPGAEFVVRIDPGAGGEGRFLRKPDDSDNAFATYFRWDTESARYEYYLSVTLPHPIMPNVANINRVGYLVTIDNCVGRNWLPAIGIFSPDGLLVKSYALRELYTPEMLGNMPAIFSDEVITGSCPGWLSNENSVVVSSESVFVTDAFGKIFDFSLSNGSYEYR